MIMKKIFLLAVVFVMTLSTMANAQSWDFYPGGTYNNNITKPQDFLGYELGERFTFHHQIIAYLKKIAEESDRLEFHTYGQTYERRPLTYLIITSSANHSNLDKIRSDNLKLADPRTTQSSEAENIIHNNKGIAWLGYGVHGNEACSAEAAMLTAYQLAAGTDPSTMNILNDLVTILDPLYNPDGRDRYVYSYNSKVDKNPSDFMLAAERSAGRDGRTNHYGFDLNRDWAFQTQIESKERIKLYKKWLPQVAVDFHEMGWNSSYFFFPAADPINEGFPQSVKDWGALYGKANANAFDRFGWEYFTHEGYDLLYPGFGDSWASFSGAIGMTYEQGGGGFASITLKRGEGDYVTLKDRLWHHFTSGMATLTTLRDNRERSLRDYYNYFTTALENGRSGLIRNIIIPPAQNPITMNIMIESLLGQGIEVKKASEAFKAKKSHGYFDSNVTEEDFEVGSYIIDLEQPLNRLVKVLFEPQQSFPDTFFYDVSAWAYPYATNIETYWTESNLDVSTTTLTQTDFLNGGVTNTSANYAYLLPLKGVESTLAVYDLIKEGLKGGIANRKFTLEGVEYPRGTAIFHKGRNKDVVDLAGKIRAAADKFGITIYGSDTGLSEDGIDLGSRRISKLVEPKIGVVGSIGTVRHMFDQRYNIDFVSIDASQISKLDVDDINVLIVRSNISSALDTDVKRKKLKDWVQAGGVYVGWGGGATYAMSKKGDLAAKLKLAKAVEKSKEDKETEDELLQSITVEDNERRRKQFTNPGWFARVNIDNTHPLGYGIKKEIAVLKFRSTAFELTKNPAMVGRFSENVVLSGYIHPDNSKRIENKGYLYSNKVGQGKVILFSDDPTWRNFLSGLEPILLNAVLLMVSQ